MANKQTKGQDIPEVGSTGGGATDEVPTLQPVKTETTGPDTPPVVKGEGLTDAELDAMLKDASGGMEGMLKAKAEDAMKERAEIERAVKEVCAWFEARIDSAILAADEKAAARAAKAARDNLFATTLANSVGVILARSTPDVKPSIVVKLASVFAYEAVYTFDRWSRGEPMPRPDDTKPTTPAENRQTV